MTAYFERLAMIKKHYGKYSPEAFKMESIYIQKYGKVDGFGNNEQHTDRFGNNEEHAHRFGSNKEDTEGFGNID